MVINTIEAPLWTSINHVPAQYPWLDEDIRCEVAVVGSGISAAMCALHFAQAGIDTVMLGDGPLGHGGTAVSSGMMGIDGEESLGDLVGEIGSGWCTQWLPRQRRTARGFTKTPPSTP